jgi:hypothetical protein
MPSKHSQQRASCSISTACQLARLHTTPPDRAPFQLAHARTHPEHYLIPTKSLPTLQPICQDMSHYFTLPAPRAGVEACSEEDFTGRTLCSSYARWLWQDQ